MRVASLNVSGAATYFDEIEDIMDTNHIDLLLIQETWLKPNNSTYNKQPNVIVDLRQTPPPNMHRGVGGIMIIRNTNTTTACDCKVLFTDPEFNYAWIEFKQCIIGCFYLPPLMTEDKCKTILNSSTRYLHEKTYVFNGRF